MAAPIGHIACALALLHGAAHHEGALPALKDQSAFLLGTNFPDVRYISTIPRAKTHEVSSSALAHVLEADSSFEAGRRFHVYVDRAREKYMREHNAYRFFNNDPLKTQFMKIVEDHILFHAGIGKVDLDAVFGQVREEELAYGIEHDKIVAWHEILKSYLNYERYLCAWRYLTTLMLFQNAYVQPESLWLFTWSRLRALGFFLYAYYHVENLTRNEELKQLILRFYLEEFPKNIAQEKAKILWPEMVHAPARSKGRAS